jgi:hypothetical protein
MNYDDSVEIAAASHGPARARPHAARRQSTGARDYGEVVVPGHGQTPVARTRDRHRGRMGNFPPRKALKTQEMRK